jgi:phage/plasmid-associated DNA primase
VVDKMDIDPHVIGVLNGILDLDLYSDDPKPFICENYSEYVVTKTANAKYIEYDPNNKYVKMWMKIFEEVFIEPDVLEYMLLRFSTMIENITAAEKILFCIAGGSNGKSLVSDSIIHVIGDYAAQFSKNLLINPSKGGGADPELMQMKGIRGGHFTETDEGAILDAGRLKILGEYHKTGRSLYENMTTFKSLPTINIFSNHKFTVLETDEGTWRRQEHYRCKVKFCDNPDPRNKFEKKVDRSLKNLTNDNTDSDDALFSILVHKRCELQRLYKGNLEMVPRPTIVEETKMYRKTQDSIYEFVTKKLLRLIGFNDDNTYDESITMIEYPGVDLTINILTLVNEYRNYMRDYKNIVKLGTFDELEKKLLESCISKYFQNMFDGIQLDSMVLVGFRISNNDRRVGEYYI